MIKFKGILISDMSESVSAYDKHMGMNRKCYNITDQPMSTREWNTEHRQSHGQQEHNQRKKTRSVSLIKMIAKLERTSRYILQKERTTAKANRDLDIFYWPNERSIFFCP